MLGLLVLSLSACLRQGNICLTAKTTTGCDTVISDNTIDKPRFQFPVQGPQPIPGGHDFWLRGGDSLTAAWDSFVLSISEPGTMCLSSTAASPPKCQQCNYKNLKDGNCKSELVGFDLLTVESFAGFHVDSPSVALGHIDDDASVSNLSYTFTPSESATLRLTTPIDDRGILAESKVFVLNEGMSLPVSFRIDPLPQNVQDAVFFSGSIPRDSTTPLTDNFSTNLRIGRVRVLKGHAQNDPLSGKLSIKDASILKPSRVVLIPDYFQGESVNSADYLRCYSDPNAADGALDFTACRTSPGATGTSLDATPAYLKSAPQSVLTWVAEFKPSDGGVIPQIIGDEIVAIEFTIQ
jgi:hypothetical protein